MKTPLKKTFDNPEYLQKSRRYDHKCVCQICVCGKHKCPQKGYKLQTQTTNNYYYKPYNITTPQQRYKKDQRAQTTHYDPQIIQTSYKTHYSPHKISKQPESSFKPNNKYQPSKIKIETQTEYNKSYIPKEHLTQRVYNNKNKTFKPNTAKFQGQTTYSREYSPKKADYSPSPVKRNNYQPNKSPLQSSTTYKNFYTPHKIQKASPIKPIQNMIKSPRFEGQSRYRQFYKPYKIETKQRCPTEYLPIPQDYRSPYKQHLHYSAQKNVWQ